MSTTGNIIAGTGTSVARGTNTAWTNPGNITANDNTVASCNSGTTGSSYLRASNFAFNIPANSLIQGFTVQVEMAESSTGAETVSVQLVGAAGTLIGTAKTFSANGTALTVYTTGTPTDLWGTTGLTAADVNDTDFGVYVWYTTTHNTTVDYISIDVNYAPPVSGTLIASETGSDTFSSTGDVIVKGSLSVSETGADAFDSQGTTSVSTVVGDLHATEVGSDSFASSGKVLVKGLLAATETADTFSASGKVVVNGSASLSESGADLFDSQGTTSSNTVVGDLHATETGDDSFSASGLIIISGSLSGTETGNDSFLGSGSESISGSLVVSEIGNDTAFFEGYSWFEYPLPSTVLAGIRYGENGQYIGTATAGGTGTRIEIVSGKIVKLVGETGALLIN